MMRVILREDMPNLGEAGEVVDVKDGYARNYLIPRKLAMEATEGNLKTYEDIARARETRFEKEVAAARDTEGRLAGLVLTFHVEVGEEDHMYGSVTTQMVVDALQEEGFDLERRHVLLKAPIKELGTHEVAVHLHKDVEPVVTVVVEKRPDEEEEEEEEEPTAS